MTDLNLLNPVAFTSEPHLVLHRRKGVLGPPEETSPLAPHQAQAPQANSSALVSCMQALHAQEHTLPIVLPA